jgi:hypothetical protein
MQPTSTDDDLLVSWVFELSGQPLDHDQEHGSALDLDAPGPVYSGADGDDRTRW